MQSACILWGMNLKELQDRLGEERQHIQSVMSDLGSLAGDGGLGGSASKLSLEKHYRLFREYVVHEDALINKRLLWNINIQGFLLAGYGYTVQKLAEVQKDPLACPPEDGLHLLRFLIVVIPILGIAISLLGWLGVEAARKAIEKLRDGWKTAQSEHPNETVITMPGLVGAGNDLLHTLGLLAPRLFPWAFCVIWVTLLWFYRQHSGSWFHFGHGT